MKETETIGLSSILKEKNIVVREGFKNIKELIDFSLSLIYDDISDEVIKKIIEEKKEIMYSSPVFDNGLVIPHIRIDVLNFFSSLVVLKNPIILDEDKKIWICFTLISPLNKKFFEKHLKILSTVASVFKNPSEFISLTPSKIYSVIFQR